MNNIEWKEGAVCYADGEQWYVNCCSENNKYQLKNSKGNRKYSFYGIVNYSKDFQLNEPRQGDYIPKSELDTEQKYNDAIEVFGLFGCVRNSAYAECKHLPFYEYLKVSGTSAIATDNKGNRKITYSQLMAIGKLKRLMNERDNLKRWGEYSRCLQVDLGDVKAKEPCAGGFSVGYECNTSEKPNSSEFKDGDKYIRTIYGLCGTPVKVDVYRVSDAFPTGSAPIDHAVKKMLCAGLRGHKDKLTDIDNAIESLQAARLLLIQKGEE